jgi:hypothetical protein
MAHWVAGGRSVEILRIRPEPHEAGEESVITALHDFGDLVGLSGALSPQSWQRYEGACNDSGLHPGVMGVAHQSAG